MDRRFRGAAVLTAVLAAAIVGVVSYNAGVSHGLAISPAVANAPVGAFGPPYGWYRPWGFGFGFGPLFFLVFWFLALRLFFWGGMHRRRGQYFEEWHRRAHERMNNQGG